SPVRRGRLISPALLLRSRAPPEPCCPTPGGPRPPQKSSSPHERLTVATTAPGSVLAMSHVISDRPPGLGAAGADPLAATQPSGAVRQRTRLVEIVIPVYNEQQVLAASVHRLHTYLAENL